MAYVQQKAIRAVGFAGLTTKRHTIDGELLNMRVWANDLARRLGIEFSQLASMALSEKALVSSVPIAGQTIVFADIGINVQPTSSYPALALADSGGFVAISAKTTTGFGRLLQTGPGACPGHLCHVRSMRPVRCHWAPRRDALGSRTPGRATER